MRILLVAVASMLLIPLVGPTAQEPPQDAGPPDYGREVLPILEANCLRCHNAAKQEGGLLMESFDDLMRGGDSGERPIVPGHAEESPLILQLEGRAKPKMPPKRDLPSDEIAVLRAWVDGGAVYSAPRRVSLDERVPRIEQTAPVDPQVASVAFHPGGGEIAASGYRVVKRFGWPGLAPLPPFGGMSDLVRAVAYSPDGALLAAGGGTPGVAGEVLLLEARTGEVRHSLDGHRDYVYHLAFSPDGRLLATCGYDRLVRVWNVESGKPVSVLREHTEAIFAVAFSPDGALLASAAADRSIKIWDVESGSRQFTLTDPTDAVTTLAFDPRGRMLAAGAADKSIRLWEVTPTSGRQVRVTLAHTSGLIRLAYSPDGTRLASSATDERVKIWNSDTGEEVSDLGDQSDWPQALGWSPNGQLLAVGRYDGTVSVYHTETGQLALDAPAAAHRRSREVARQ